MSLSQFFKDGTESFSMKRLSFFLFSATWILLCLFHYSQASLDSCERIIVWLGGFILAENAVEAVKK